MVYCLDAGFLNFDFGAFATQRAPPTTECVVVLFDILSDVDEACGVWRVEHGYRDNEY